MKSDKVRSLALANIAVGKNADVQKLLGSSEYQALGEKDQLSVGRLLMTSSKFSADKLGALLSGTKKLQKWVKQLNNPGTDVSSTLYPAIKRKEALDNIQNLLKDQPYLFQQLGLKSKVLVAGNLMKRLVSTSDWSIDQKGVPGIMRGLKQDNPAVYKAVFGKVHEAMAQGISPKDAIRDQTLNGIAVGLSKLAKSHPGSALIGGIASMVFGVATGGNATEKAMNAYGAFLTGMAGFIGGPLTTATPFILTAATWLMGQWATRDQAAELAKRFNKNPDISPH
jgi:hypothetical protein